MGPTDPDNQRPETWSSAVLQKSPNLRRSTLSRLPPDPSKRANSYLRFCRRLRVSSLQWSKAHARRSFLNSEAKRSWRSWGTWGWA